jgi:glycosyltransferase involved in cell wall biosynthesis
MSQPQHYRSTLAPTLTSTLAPTLTLPESQADTPSVLAFTPRVSVIIPVLNEEKLIERTLSVFTDNVRERYALEIIVSDGGSTDRTVEIAERYADVMVRHTEPYRQTISEGRNKGAAQAQGAVLIFLNGDTVPADVERFFSTVEQWAAAGEQSKGLYSTKHLPPTLALACPVNIAPEERKWSDVLFHAFMNTYVQALNAFGEGMGRGECHIIRAEAFRAVGGYDTRIAAGEDYDLYRRLHKQGAIGWLPATLVYESPRRFRHFGYWRVLGMWLMNSVSLIFRHKAVSEEWEAVR